jgi:hypothetical protein
MKEIGIRVAASIAIFHQSQFMFTIEQRRKRHLHEEIAERIAIRAHRFNLVVKVRCKGNYGSRN